MSCGAPRGQGVCADYLQLPHRKPSKPFLSFTDALTGTAVGLGGTILRTIDGGS